MKRGTECAVHVHHGAVPQEDHHILPQEYGGKTTHTNMARICANAHSDVHYYIALLIKYGMTNGFSNVPWPITRTFGIQVQRLAERGYSQIVAGLDAHHIEDLQRREAYLLEEAA